MQGLSPETLDFMDLHGITNIFWKIHNTEERLETRIKEKETQYFPRNNLNNNNNNNYQQLSTT